MVATKKGAAVDTMLVEAKPIALVSTAVFYLMSAWMPAPTTKEWADLWALCTGQGTAVMMGLGAFTLLMIPGGWPSWRQSIAVMGAMLVSAALLAVGAMVGGLPFLAYMAIAMVSPVLVYLSFRRMSGHRHVVDVTKPEAT